MKFLTLLNFLIFENSSELIYFNLPHSGIMLREKNILAKHRIFLSHCENEYKGKKIFAFLNLPLVNFHNFRRMLPYKALVIFSNF